MSETDYDDTDEQALEPPNQPSNHPPNIHDSIEFPSLPKRLPDNRGEKVVDQVLGTRRDKTALRIVELNEQAGRGPAPQ